MITKFEVYNLKFEDLINRLPKEIVDNLKNTEQDSIYHYEGNAYIHTKMVFNETKKTGDIDLVIASIFHDLGKIDTHSEKIKDGKRKISHIGHEIKSLDYIDNYFYLYEDLTKNKEKIKEIVKNHMKCHLYETGKMKKPIKRKRFEENPYFKDIIKFTECDEKGRISGN